MYFVVKYDQKIINASQQFASDLGLISDTKTGRETYTLIDGQLGDYELPINDSSEFEAGLKVSNINSESILDQFLFSNGIKLDSVGIRYKGNSTFYITNSFGVPKLPWNIDINEYFIL